MMPAAAACVPGRCGTRGLRRALRGKTPNHPPRGMHTRLQDRVGGALLRLSLRVLGPVERV